MSDDQLIGAADPSVPDTGMGESQADPTTQVDGGDPSVTPEGDGSQAQPETPVTTTEPSADDKLAEMQRRVEMLEREKRIHQSRADKMQAEWGAKIQELERQERERIEAILSDDNALQDRINQVGYAKAMSELAQYQARKVYLDAQEVQRQQIVNAKWQDANNAYFETAKQLGVSRETAEQVAAKYGGFVSFGDPDIALDAAKDILKAYAPARSAEQMVRAAEQRVRQLAAQQNPKGTTGAAITPQGEGDDFFAGIDKARDRHALKDIL